MLFQRIGWIVYYFTVPFLISLALFKRIGIVRPVYSAIQIYNMLVLFRNNGDTRISCSGFGCLM